MQYIGSDFQTQPINTQVQDAKMLDVPDIANASANSIRQSVADVQRMNSAAANADAEAAGRKVVVQQPQGGGGIIGAFTDIAKVGLSYVEAQKKAEALQAEKDFIIESEKLSANAPDLINKTDQGGIGYQSQIEALTSKYSNRVDANLLNKQLLRMYSPIQQYQELGVTALRKEADKIKESNVEVFVKRQVLSLDTQLANLELVTNTGERQTKLDNILKIATESLVTAPFSKSEKLYITNALLTVVGKSSAKSSEEGAKFMRTVQTINETNSFIEQIQGMPDEQKASLQLSKLATLPPNLRTIYDEILDPTKVYQRQRQELKDSAELNAAVKKNEISADKAFKLTSDATLALTSRYLSADGVQRSMLKTESVNVPAYEAYILAADNYLKDQDKKIELAKESAQLAGVIAGIGKGDAKERLSWVQEAFKLPSISFGIDIVQNLQEAVKKAQKAVAGGVPEEVQKAQQDVEKYSRVVLQATQDRAKQVDDISRNINTPWTRLEEFMRDPKKREISEKAYSDALAGRRASQEQYNNSIYKGTNQNFNMPQLAELQVGDVKLPLPFKVGTQVSYTGDYGENRGSHQHSGIDIAVAENTPLIAPIGGVIVTAGSDGGYGNFIDLRTPDGKVLRYAHLNKMSVKEGQKVMPGQALGLTGNTGRSSGAHLHFEVRNDMYGGFEKTEDPIAWSIKNLNNANRGVNSRRGANTPANTPPNAFPLSGAYLQDGKIVREDGTVGTPSYNNRNPIREIRLPMDKNSYSSSPDKNYGYQELAKNPSFRKELYRVAKTLNTPMQWLADAMAFETGGTFASSIDNGLGYTGLIQFGDEAAQDVGTTRSALAQMSNTEQLKYVEKFLKMRSDNYGLKYDRPESIIMGIWGRIVDIQNYVKDPQSVRNVKDTNISFANYVNRLGEHAGRKYETSYTAKVAPVHNTYRSSCLSCQALVRAGMGFLPHQAP